MCFKDPLHRLQDSTVYFLDLLDHIQERRDPVSALTLTQSGFDKLLVGSASWCLKVRIYHLGVTRTHKGQAKCPYRISQDRDKSLSIPVIL